VIGDEIEPVDVLRTPAAGGMVIRGGAIRAVGYGLSVLLAAVTSVLLLRYLGVDDFGRYGVVGALLGIVSLITEAGLTALGSRELAVVPAGERDRLLANLVTLRIVLTSAGVVVAALVAVALRYEPVVVAGTLVGGIGVVLLNAQTTLTLPLRVELRYVAVTAIEVLNQALTAVLVGVLVVAGAALMAFFGVQIAVGLVSIAATLAIVGVHRMRPAIDRATLRYLVREGLPLAAAVAMNVVYLNLLVVFVSLLTNETDTGLFATSFRVFTMLVGLPTLVLAVALPLLAVAGAEDRERFRYGLQRLTEVALLVGLLEALVAVLLAAPAIALLGGPDYADAAPILQIQALALVPVFLTQTWTLALLSLRRQRDVAVANAVALAFVVVVGLTLVTTHGTKGAAVAGVLTEALLALLLLGLLFRGDRAVAPSLTFVWRPLLAVAAGSAVGLVLDVSGWIEAPVAAAVFVAVAVLVRAVPPEVLAALRRRGPAPGGGE